MQVDVLVIGGGSAGMAAACAAYNTGTENVLIVERQDRLGGILQQCIHNGFGIHRFNEDMTGVEYARRYVQMVRARSIRVMTETFVVGLSKDRTATLVHPQEGLISVKAKAIVLAMGCRERTRASLLIPGCRGAGILTAGTAQRFMNVEGYLPGKEIVILGSGDIGLIMARQLTCEGAVVKRVVEILPYSTGLQRNIVQCLEDFSIPISFSSTIVNVHGRERVQGVTASRVDEERNPIPGTEEDISCDTLLLSAGLIPENELSQEAGITLSPATKGAFVDNYLQTSVDGIFACGNVLHVHDLVDHVSAEAEVAGVNAARFALGELAPAIFEKRIEVHDGCGVSGVTPKYVYPEACSGTVVLTFRPRFRMMNCRIEVEQEGKVLYSEARGIVSPGEMEGLAIPAGQLSQGGESVSIRIVPETDKRHCACGPIPYCLGDEDRMKKLVCIMCPLGCRMCYEFNENGLVFLAGNQCRKGSEYVHQETLNPKRILTSIIPVADRAHPLSVKTVEPIPKRLHNEAVAALGALKVAGPVACGDILIPDICGTGVAVVATQDIR